MSSTYYIELAAEAKQDLANMRPQTAEEAYRDIERGLGRPGREHQFRFAVLEGVVSPVWRTYVVAKVYTAVFAFMTSEQRHRLGLSTSAHVVAAIPSQDRLDEVLRRLYEEAAPDD
jgi:hypothetical protein